MNEGMFFCKFGRSSLSGKLLSFLRRRVLRLATVSSDPAQSKDSDQAQIISSKIIGNHQNRHVNSDSCPRIFVMLSNIKGAVWHFCSTRAGLSSTSSLPVHCP